MGEIAIVGAGYVGLVTAACFAHLGHRVVCCEQDRARLARLARGALPIREPGLDRLVARGRATGRLRFAEAPGEGDAAIAFVAVGTPATERCLPDTRHARAAALEVAGALPAGGTLVVKSTVPPGFGDAIAAELAARGRDDLQVVVNPEFLRQGSAVADFLAPDRIVVGVGAGEPAERVLALYGAGRGPAFVVSRRSAELAKYVANAYLATRLSFVNEVAAICEASEADLPEVVACAGSDPRIGTHYFEAGIGWGGSCLPKDLAGLTGLALDAGIEPDLLRAVAARNRRALDETVALITALVAGEANPAVALLGLTFKPGTDDRRDSPAVAAARTFAGRGIAVRAHDPVARPAFEPGIVTCESPLAALEGADAVLLATAWPDYLALDWARAAVAMRGSTVVDGRRALSREAVERAGLRYFAPGYRMAPASGPGGGAVGDSRARLE